MRHHPNDILLTGVPRSGTTLCCNLLNHNPQVLALAEPMRIADFLPDEGREAACDRIDAFLAATRERALREGKAPSLQHDGAIADNPIGEARADQATRPRVMRLGDVEIGRALPADFHLVVKHNALFAALLPELCQRFTMYAVVREPLAVLASWNSVDLPVREGRVPAGEMYDVTLRAALDAEPERIGRQLRVLDWFFGRILRSVPSGQIIRYEELVVAGSGPAAQLGVPELATEDHRNRNRSYPAELLAELESKLAARRGAWRELYPRTA